MSKRGFSYYSNSPPTPVMPSPNSVGLAKKEKELRKAFSDLAAEKQTVSYLECDVREKNAQLQQKDERIKTLTKAVASLKTTIAEHESCQEFRTLYEAEQEENQRLKSQLKMIPSLETTISSLDKELASVFEEKHCLENQLLELKGIKRDHDDLADELLYTKIKLDEANLNIQQKDYELEILKAQHDSDSKKIFKMRTTYEERIAVLEDSIAEGFRGFLCSDASGEVVGEEFIDKKVQELEEEISELRKLQHSNETSINELEVNQRMKIELMMSEADQLKNRLSDLTSSLAAKDTQNAELAQTLNETQQRNASLKRSLETKNEEISKCEQDVTKFHEDILLLQKVTKSLEFRKASLKEENKKMKIEYESVVKKFDGLAFQWTTQIDFLRGQVSNHQQQLDTLTQEFHLQAENHKNELKTLEDIHSSEADMKNAEYDKLLAKLTDVTTMLTTEKGQTSSLSENLREVQETNGALIKSLEEKSSEIAEIKSQVEICQTQIATYQEQNCTLLQEKDEAISCLHQQVENHKTELKTLEEIHSNEVDMKYAECDNLLAKLADVTAMLNTEKGQTSALSENLREVQETNGALIKSLEEKSSEIAEIKSQVEICQTQIATYQEQNCTLLQEKDEAISCLHQQVENHKTELKTLEEIHSNEVDMKNAECDKLLAKLADVTTMLTTEKGQTSALSENLREVQETNGALIKSLEEKSSEIAEIKSQVEICQTQIATYQEQNCTLLQEKDEAISCLHQQVENHKNELKTLEDIHSSEADMKNAECDKLLAKLADVTTMLTTEKGQTSALSENLREVQETNGALIKSLEEKSSEIAEIKSQVEICQTQIATYQEQNCTLLQEKDEAVSCLHQQIENHKTELKTLEDIHSSEADMKNAECDNLLAKLADVTAMLNTEKGQTVSLSEKLLEVQETNGALIKSLEEKSSEIAEIKSQVEICQTQIATYQEQNCTLLQEKDEAVSCLHQQIENHKTELKTLEEIHSNEVDMKNAECDNLLAKLADVTAMLNTEKGQTSALSENLQEVQEANGALLKSLEEKSSEIAEIKSQVEICQTQIATYQEQNCTLLQEKDEAVSCLHQQVENHKTELKTLEEIHSNEADMKNAECDKLLAKLADVTTMLTAEKGQTSALSENLREVQETNGALIKSLEEKSSEIAEIKSQVEICQTQIATYQEQNCTLLQEKDESISCLHQQVENHKTELKTLEEIHSNEVDMKYAECDNLLAKLADVTAMLNTEKGQTVALSEKLLEVQETNGALIKSLEEKSSEIAEIKSQVEICQTQIATYQEQICTLLQEKDEAVSCLHQQVENHKTELKTLGEHCNTDVAKKVAECVQLQEKLSALTIVLDGEKSQNMVLSANLTELHCSNDALMKSVEEKTNKIATSEVKIGVIQAQVVTYQEQLDSLTREKAEAIAELDRYKEIMESEIKRLEETQIVELGMKKAECDKLQERLTELTAELAAEKDRAVELSENLKKAEERIAVLIKSLEDKALRIAEVESQNDTYQTQIIAHQEQYQAVNEAKDEAILELQRQAENYQLDFKKLEEIHNLEVSKKSAECDQIKETLADLTASLAAEKNQTFLVSENLKKSEMTNSSLIKSLEEKTVEIAEWKSQNEIYHRQIAACQEQYDVLKQEKEALSELRQQEEIHATELMKREEIQSVEIGKKNTECVELQEKLANLTSMLAANKSQSVELSENLKELQQTNSNVIKSLEEKSVEIAASELQNESLRAQIATYTKQCDALRQEKHDAISELDLQAERHKTELKRLEDSHKTLIGIKSAECGHLLEQLATLGETIGAEKRQNMELSENLNESLRRCTNLRKSLEEKQDEISSYHLEVTEKEEVIVALEQHMSKLKTHIDHYKLKLNEAILANSLTTEKIGELKKEIEKLSSQKRSLQMELERSEERVRDLTRTTNQTFLRPSISQPALRRRSCHLLTASTFVAAAKQVPTDEFNENLEDSLEEPSVRDVEDKENCDTNISSISSICSSRVSTSRMSQRPNAYFGGHFVCEDEEGEFLNYSYLADLKKGKCETDNADGNRLGELQRRNTLCLPHLKTSYPVETQMCVPYDFKDDDLKRGTAIKSEPVSPQSVNGNFGGAKAKTKRPTSSSNVPVKLQGNVTKTPSSLKRLLRTRLSAKYNLKQAEGIRKNLAFTVTNSPKAKTKKRPESSNTQTPGKSSASGSGSNRLKIFRRSFGYRSSSNDGEVF